MHESAEQVNTTSFGSSYKVMHRTVALTIGRLVRVAALGLVLSVPWAYDIARMQLAAERLGPRAVASLPALQSLLQPVPQADDEMQLAAVNEFFNRRIVFRDDAQAWGQIDRWTSPLELLDKGEGDCEDYVIAKYFSLLALGMPAQRLRLVYVRAHVGGESIAHMVLAYYAQPGAEPLILDNLVGSVRPASRRPDLTPVFSFNSDGMWEGTGSQSAGHPQSRLSRWREVLAKAQAEGFF
jgi:predicted transglutaminase-like cysteine proteinase